MKQPIAHVAVVVRDDDNAIEFYTSKLGFRLVENTCAPEQDKRRVVVAPFGSSESTALPAKGVKADRCRLRRNS